MILIGIGANLPRLEFGGPRETCAAALQALEGRGIHVRRRSRWYRSAPVPASGQPDFVNAVAELETGLSPSALLAGFHWIEADFGRVRGLPNEPRIIDLDLLAYHDLSRAEPDGLVLPHPRLQDRAFVLLPLRDIDPTWRHPVLGDTVDVLIGRLSGDQDCTPID